MQSTVPSTSIQTAFLVTAFFFIHDLVTVFGLYTGASDYLSLSTLSTIATEGRDAGDILVELSGMMVMGGAESQLFRGS